MIRGVVLKLIWLYQHSFSLLTRGSCRYHPSCSEYTRQQFEQNPLPIAFMQSIRRLVTCNQLFVGGFDYVKVASLCQNPKNLTINSIKYWLVPNADKGYFLIKNFRYKG